MNEASINSQMPKNPIITSISSDSQLTHEVSEEFSLPDYVPEVRRVLYTKAAVLPEGKFISDSGANTSLEFDGTVTYNVIYTDDEGKLCSTPLSTNYNEQTIISGHPDTVFIDTAVDSVTCRVTAPRKLTIKSRLKSRIMSFTDSAIEENITPRSTADEIFIERYTKSLNTVSLKAVSMQNIKMSDKFDSSEKEELVPVMCDASITITECKAHNGSIAVRGAVNVRCLCHGGEKDIMLTKSLPLYEELEAEGATSTDMARCVGRCVSLSISNEQNNDTCRLFFDVSCEIEGEFYRNEANSVTKDCYSTKYESQSSFKSIDTYSLVSAKNHSFSINDKFKKKDSSVESVVSALCEITGEKTELKNGKLMLSGKIQAAVIGKTAETEAKNSEYVSEIYEIPFRYDIPCDDGDIISRINYDAVISSARYEGDKFNISLEVYPSVSIFKRTAEEILDACVIKKDKEYKNDPSCVRVFFPKDCDILWEVAKKYHTTQRKIVEDNELPSYSLENVKSIII